MAVPPQQTEEGTEAAAAAEHERSQKIMNRAGEIAKNTPYISMATAINMASKEIK